MQDNTTEAGRKGFSSVQVRIARILFAQMRNGYALIRHLLTTGGVDERRGDDCTGIDAEAFGSIVFLIFIGPVTGSSELYGTFETTPVKFAVSSSCCFIFGWLPLVDADIAL